MKFRALGLVAALALSLTACGNQEDEASKAISDKMVSSSDETFQVNREQADCVGDGLVDKIGVDQLKEYNVLTEDMKADSDIESVKMSEGDADSAADVMLDCTDVKGLFDQAIGQVPDEVKSCLDEKLNDEVIHDFLVKVFQGDEEGGQQQLMTALQDCISS